MKKTKSKEYIVGIDAGSVSLNCMVINENKDIIFEFPYKRHFGKIDEEALDLITALFKKFGKDNIRSISFTGSHGKKLGAVQNSELNGLKFSDMPWLLDGGELKRTSRQIWPDRKESQQRLFAMGYDAYRLIEKLAQLRAFPELGMQGQTGKLFVNEQGVVERSLSWAEYLKGEAQRVPDVEQSE